VQNSPEGRGVPEAASVSLDPVGLQNRQVTRSAWHLIVPSELDRIDQIKNHLKHEGNSFELGVGNTSR
jgi:hypothetical protein